jgi:hypothetical protein
MNLYLDIRAYSSLSLVSDSCLESAVRLGNLLS